MAQVFLPQESDARASISQTHLWPPYVKNPFTKGVGSLNLFSRQVGMPKWFEFVIIKLDIV